MPETKSKSKRDTQDKMYSVEEGIVLPKDEYQRIWTHYFISVLHTNGTLQSHVKYLWIRTFLIISAPSDFIYGIYKLDYYTINPETRSIKY